MNEEIAASIRQQLARGTDVPAVEVVLEGNRASITVISDVFQGMSRVQKQQAVYACIDSFIADGRLHAVTIRALVPDEAAP
ncbi:MAG: BolA/IbaG family iron-sulfur metabolism protein [Pseudomonadales bacterium]